MAASKRRAARAGKPAAPSKRGGKPGDRSRADKRDKAARADRGTQPDRPGRKRKAEEPEPLSPVIEVRRIHRRDLNRVWAFLKLSFAHVNPRTVEYQRPRTKKRFDKTYEEEGVEQLVFEVGDHIVAYAECAFEVVGSDNWINEAYFEGRDMRPLFVEELAVHPDWNGRGVGGFVLEQLHHLAKVRGLTHLVLEVAENNEHALSWYRKRGFRKLDAAIFLAASVENEPELLPPKPISMPPPPAPDEANPPPAPIPEE